MQEITSMRLEMARDILNGSLVVRDTELTILEDEIERLALRPKYITALMEITKPASLAHGYSYDASIDSWWGLIRATPQQRAQAFLEAINYLEITTPRPTPATHR